MTEEELVVLFKQMSRELERIIQGLAEINQRLDRMAKEFQEARVRSEWRFELLHAAPAKRG